MNFREMSESREQLKPALRLRRKNLTTYGSARGIELRRNYGMPHLYFPGTSVKHPK